MISVSITQPQNIGSTTSFVELVQEHASLYKFGQIAPPAPPVPISAGPLSAQAILEDLGKLEEDWDGYGALVIAPDICAHARRFLASVPEGMPTPEISPTSNGTVCFEWVSGEEDAYLEIGRTRYSGHVQPRHGSAIYLEGQLTGNSIEQESATTQVIAVIKQLLYAAYGSKSSAHSIQITESAL